MPSLNHPEEAVRLFHRSFQRKSAVILARPGTFEDKKTDLGKLCDTLKTYIEGLNTSDFPTPQDKDSEHVEAMQCLYQYHTCTKSPEQCEDDYWDCLSQFS